MGQGRFRAELLRVFSGSGRPFWTREDLYSTSLQHVAIKHTFRIKLYLEITNKINGVKSKKLSHRTFCNLSLFYFNGIHKL